MDKQVQKANAAKKLKAAKTLEGMDHIAYWLEENTGAELSKITLIDRDGEWLLIITASSSEGPQIAFISADSAISALVKLVNQVKGNRLKLKLDENKIKWLTQDQDPV